MASGARRLDGVQRGPSIRFTWNGEELACHAGETLAAALLTRGVVSLRRTARGDARGVFCGMGACFECRVTVIGRGTVRACVTPVTEGMAAASQDEGGPLNLAPHDSAPSDASPPQPGQRRD